MTPPEKRHAEATGLIDVVAIVSETDSQAGRIARGVGLPCVFFRDSQTFLAQPPALTPTAVFISVLANDDATLTELGILRSRHPDALLIVVLASQIPTLKMEIETLIDDVLIEPFDPIEVGIRLRMRQRDLGGRRTVESLQVGDITLTAAKRSVRGPLGERILPQLDYDLLAMLASASGAAVSRQDLHQRLWGNTRVTGNALEARVCMARKALADVTANVQILTIYKTGYRLLCARERPPP